MQHGGSSTCYTGIDRRRARPGQRDTITAAELGMFLVGLLVLGLALPALLSGVGSVATALHTQAAIRSTWAMLFVCAGLFRLVRWRLTGDTLSVLVGAAMFCFGLLSAPTAPLAPLIHNSARDVSLSPVTRTVAVVACLTLLVRAFRSAPVDARVHPLRVITATLGLAWVVLLSAMVANQTGHALALPAWGWLLVGSLLSAGWFAIAAVAGRRGVRQSNASLVWISLGTMLLGSAELLHAVAFVRPEVIVLYSGCLHLVAGGLAFVNSGTELSLVFSADGNRMLSLSGALLQTEQQLAADEEEDQVRLHDARSVIAALKMASLTLHRYDERLEADVKHRLRSSLVSELTRLERVIDGRREEPLEVFRLDTALGPVLTAERQNGLVINNQLGSIRVLGRPVELATVMQNLLANARHYAPGSTVRVRAEASGDGVQIVVEDRGPGVPATEQERVFERGYRASSAGDSTGSGLGLYLARRLMREQAGEIVLRDRDGGGASFLLSLPRPSGEIGRAAATVHDVGAAVIRLAPERDDDRSATVLTVADGSEVGHRSMFVRRRHVQAM